MRGGQAARIQNVSVDSDGNRIIETWQLVEGGEVGSEASMMWEVDSGGPAFADQSQARSVSSSAANAPESRGATRCTIRKHKRRTTGGGGCSRSGRGGVRAHAELFLVFACTIDHLLICFFWLLDFQDKRDTAWSKAIILVRNNTAPRLFDSSAHAKSVRSSSLANAGHCPPVSCAWS